MSRHDFGATMCFGVCLGFAVVLTWQVAAINWQVGAVVGMLFVSKAWNAWREIIG